MTTVNIQAKLDRKEWEDIPKVQHTFESETEVAKFAYRLALQFECEVRVSSPGFDNGRYFNFSHADEYLSNN